MDPADLAGLFLEFLEREHNISPEDLRQVLSQRDERSAREQARSTRLVPLAAFSERLGAFETVVKFLREAYGLRHGEIAQAVGRSEATIRTAYRAAVRKRPEEFTLEGIPGEALVAGNAFPAMRLSDRSLSVFEHLVDHLLGRGMRLHEIAKAIRRDDRTVWTVRARAKRKLSSTAAYGGAGGGGRA